MVNHRIDISHKTIFFVVGFLALLWALYLVRDVIVFLFVAIILMSGLSPVVRTIHERLRFPRGVAIAITYIIIIALIGLLLTLVVSPMLEQTNVLITRLPATISAMIPAQYVNQELVQQELTNISHNALTYSLEIFNNLIAFVSVAVLTAYLLIERDKLDGLVAQFFIGKEERVKKTLERIEDKLGAWLRGQVALSLIVGVMSYLVLFALNVPYAVPLAVLAGLMEVVPVIGPIIAAIPAIIIAYLVSPVLAVMVGIGYLIIQQLEGHFIVPQVMKKAVGLNPLIVILAVAIGGRLLGIAGALLAVPLVAVFQIVTEDVLKDDVEELVP